ncbi:hypothetical protein BKA82DRAFT_1001460 [Pisolithus tinctorius]|uniref:Uncharacterized protein n=1 Tax=Pisolithus tinctorius Marx 270 TaxID=870435 RepID=A0A0C3J362_PISTI|nr:hypothetical protein BKA82DRAFT_1001460 [Pisolithus tinctorius]KIO03518.1 hypothetical protein M404DRAFT_1001460 [Pisolithus tinctorius Marx 270]
MGSVLSHTTIETAVVVIVTVACTTLAYTFALRFTPAGSGTQLADAKSSQQPSIAGTKSKRKKRGTKSQTDAGAAEEIQSDPKSSRAGERRVVSKAQPSKPDPAVTPSPKVVPGDFETQIETSASAGNAAAHSSQEPDVAKAKRGKKKKLKANLVHPDSGAPIELHSTKGISREQLMLRESDGRSSSAVSTVKSEDTEPNHQQQRERLLNPETSLKREPQLQSSPSFDTDGSWTRVGSHSPKESDGKAGVSVAVSTNFTSSDVGASAAGESFVAEIMDEDIGDPTDGNVAETRRTLAEKLIPKPRRTGVEDMLQKPDVPALARVMRVVPRADGLQVQGSTWKNFEDDATPRTTVNDTDGEDDGGWDIVKGKSSRNLGTTLIPQQTTPLLPQLSPDRAMTKKQRQNAKKREVVRAAKAEAEATRLEGLAKHKRQLERQRIIEQSRSGGGKRPSGGMQAVVDDKGKLVWE